MPAPKKYPDEMRERSVRLVLDLVEGPPGLVDIAHWRPGASAGPHRVAPMGAYGALATAPHPDQQ